MMMKLKHKKAIMKEQEIADFLTAYPETEIVTRYTRLRPFYHARAAAYCLWKSERGASDYTRAFDFEWAALQEAERDQNEGSKPGADQAMQ